MAQALPTALRATNLGCFLVFFCFFGGLVNVPGGFQGSLPVTQPRISAGEAIAAGHGEELRNFPPPHGVRGHPGNNGRDLSELLSGGNPTNINGSPPAQVTPVGQQLWSQAAGGSASRKGSPEAKKHFLVPRGAWPGQEKGRGQRDLIPERRVRLPRAAQLSALISLPG